MRKAIVRNNLIENIAANPSADWNPPNGTTAIDDVDNLAQIGGSYSNGVFGFAPIQADPDPLDNVDLVQLKLLFNHENRIRTLESKVPLTVAQFKAVWRALL